MPRAPQATVNRRTPRGLPSLDLEETSTIQQGVYVVHLFSADDERVYFSLYSRRTELFNWLRQERVAEELRRRGP